MKTATLAALLSLLVALAPAAGQEKDPEPFSVTARILDANDPPPLDLTVGEWTVPREEALERLVSKIEECPGAETTTTCPKLVPGRTESLSLTLVERVRYVQDFDLEVSMGGEQLNGPIHATIKEGVIADLKATPGPDGEAVVVEASLTIATLVRPIPEFTTTLAGQEVTIQLPEILVRRITKTVRVPLGGGAILPAGNSTFVVVTADRGAGEEAGVGIVPPK